jgi:hypothetical protein
MLRRLTLGALALTALGLVTVGTAAAQDQEMGGTDPGMSGTGMGMPGTGIYPLGIPGMDPRGMSGMGMGMGMPGMGPMGMGGMGMGYMGMGGMMGMSGMGMSGMGRRIYPGEGMGSTFRPIYNHPGDLSGIVPCTGCGALFDVCVFGGRCEYMEAGLWEVPGMHPTTNRPDLGSFWPQGPMACARGTGNNPATCVDAPGEWNLRAGMPGATGMPGGSGR